MNEQPDRERLNRLTESIIGCCIEIHRELGPGLLESVYEECLVIALAETGLSIKRQQDVPVTFRGQTLKQLYRYDLLVEESVLVELKAVEKLTGLHQAQVLTYLRLVGVPLGLLCNFNVPLMRDGIRRLINPSFPANLRLT